MNDDRLKDLNQQIQQHLTRMFELQGISFSSSGRAKGSQLPVNWQVNYQSKTKSAGRDYKQFESAVKFARKQKKAGAHTISIRYIGSEFTWDNPMWYDFYVGRDDKGKRINERITFTPGTYIDFDDIDRVYPEKVK